MNKQPTVAVLGLSAMGHAFADNVLKTGLATHVWNRSRSRGEDLADAGAIVCASPAEPVREADVVLTMLPDGPTTRSCAVRFRRRAGSHETTCGLGPNGYLEATEALIAADSRNLPGLQRISEVWQQAVDAGHGESDISPAVGPKASAQFLLVISRTNNNYTTFYKHL